MLVAGVGQHQMWASQFWRFTEPRRWINSGGLGTMGFAVPAAIGAKAGRPDEVVYAIDGDGCFQMTLQELITAATEQIPIKVGVINNGAHGMVKQWQKLFYGGRLSASLLGDVVDYPKLAEAMGCVGLRAETPDEVGPAIEKSLAVDDRPVVVEFVVDPEEMVFPMVPAGGSNDDVILGPEGTAVGVESASDLPRPSRRSPRAPHLSVLVEDKPGCWIASLLARRGSTSTRSRLGRPPKGMSR